MAKKDKQFDIVCPSCRDKISKAYDDEVKMRAKLVKWTPLGMFAVCKSCGFDVPVEYSFIKSVMNKFSNDFLYIDNGE